MALIACTGCGYVFEGDESLIGTTDTCLDAVMPLLRRATSEEAAEYWGLDGEESEES